MLKFTRSKREGHSNHQQQCQARLENGHPSTSGNNSAITDPTRMKLGDKVKTANALNSAAPPLTNGHPPSNGKPPNYVSSRNQQQHNNYAAVANGKTNETSFIKSNGRALPGPSLVSYQQTFQGSQQQIFNGNGGADERTAKYETEWQKRRQEQSRQSREEEFLRSSIRDSKRLQALEKGPRLSNGHANGGFINDKDDDTLAYLISGANGHHSSRQRFSVSEKVSIYEPATALGNGFRQANSMQPAFDLTNVLTNNRCDPLSSVSLELKQIFEKPKVKALVQAHDQIVKIGSTNQTRPVNGFTDNNSKWQWGSVETPLDETLGDLRIIKLYKSGDNPLGATVVQEGKSIAVGRIIKGGVAEKSGMLKEGDELMEVNGVDLRCKSVHEVCELLANMRGELEFIVAPKKLTDTPPKDAQPIVKHLRALFDYDPEDDYYLPCRELGLSFRKGDILHVISMTDANWWQAHRDGEDKGHLAGLIPSTNFQIQRECCRLEEGSIGRKTDHLSKKGQRNRSVDRGNDGVGLWCAKRRKDKKRSTSVFVSDGRKIASISLTNNGRSGGEPVDVLTYEEVALNLSKGGRKRPIVLVAPAQVGYRNLLQKLMEMETDKFARVVYHTSRPRKPEEEPGLRYHFLTRQQFQDYVSKKKFIEWGEYEKHYYGTSYESIRHIISQGKTCILAIKPQSLKAIRTDELRPFIVYISPPPFDRLKANVHREMISLGRTCPKDDELRQIFNEAATIEEKYGHYFDKTLINYDIDSSVQELLNDIYRLETEPQWVPTAWLHQ